MTVCRLRDGDYCPDRTGGFQQVSGGEALLERVLFKLTVHRGSFPFLPELGSRLYLLPRAKSSVREMLGVSYAAEALTGENVTVTGVKWEEAGNHLTVYLRWQGENLTAEVAV